MGCVGYVLNRGFYGVLHTNLTLEKRHYLRKVRPLALRRRGDCAAMGFYDRRDWRRSGGGRVNNA